MPPSPLLPFFFRSNNWLELTAPCLTPIAEILKDSSSRCSTKSSSCLSRAHAMDRLHPHKFSCVAARHRSYGYFNACRTSVPSGLVPNGYYKTRMVTGIEFPKTFTAYECANSDYQPSRRHLRQRMPITKTLGLPAAAIPLPHSPLALRSRCKKRVRCEKPPQHLQSSAVPSAGDGSLSQTKPLSIQPDLEGIANHALRVYKNRNSENPLNVSPPPFHIYQHGQIRVPNPVQLPQQDLLKRLGVTKVKSFLPVTSGTRLRRKDSRSTSRSTRVSNQTSVSSSVHIRVYDISEGAAKSLSELFLRTPIEGVWHTGILVFGYEYFYCSGILRMRPGDVADAFSMALHTTHYLGETSRSRKSFERFLRRCSHIFTPDTYDILEWNCNDFSNLCGIWLFDGQTDHPKKLRLSIDPEAIAGLETRHQKMQSLLDSPLVSPYEAIVIPSYLLNQRDLIHRLPAGALMMSCLKAVQSPKFLDTIEDAIKSHPLVIACVTAAGRLRDNFAIALADADERVRNSAANPWCC